MLLPTARGRRDLAFRVTGGLATEHFPEPKMIWSQTMMRTAPALLTAVGLLAPTAMLLRGQTLTPVWIELGGEGRTLARVIVNDAKDCPVVEIDGTRRPMELRAPVPAGFKPVCELVVPASVSRATVDSKPLPLPRPNPQRIVVLGDTGCRIRSPRLQACNDSDEWPFAQVASSIADSRPDLAVHVGDYNYREDNCPPDQAALCGGTPSGDNWDTWNAEFFAPASKLLAAVPLALARGNHEDCKRSWRGWFYYLDPRPWNGSCAVFSPPYVIRLGRFELAMMDSASISETHLVDDQIRRYRQQLKALRVTDAWLVAHHPFWAIRMESHGQNYVLNTPSLKAAWEVARPKGIHLLLSGHIHLFEVLSLKDERPPQLVAGDGGTSLHNPLPTALGGIEVAGVTISGGESVHEFGYSVLSKSPGGWDAALKTRTGETLVTCAIRGYQADCTGMRK
jgi:hypothetical protein